ncbi:MAG TPA: hypothetical protein VEI02_07805 [Planctomycetota bacterium]|nr:hypothetical protein [Planctomycetota bacterium]
MLKFGVVDLEGLARPRTLFGGARDVAAPVLWRALQTDPERYGATCSAAFNRLRMGNGVYKYTAPRRFADVERDVLELLRARLGDRALAAHDVGVSDGTTSVELFSALAPVWPRLRFTMSDYFDAVYVMTRDGDRWAGVLDAELKVIQFFGRGFVLSPLSPPRKWHPVNRILLDRLRRDLEPALLDAARDLRLDVDPPRAPAGWSVERVPLVRREALELVRTDPRARFVRHSVLDPLPEPADFIRAMNVLNRGYFGADDLRRAASRLVDGLTPGGVLLIGRNVDEEDGRTAATAWVKGPRGLERVARFHGGSEVEDAVG